MALEELRKAAKEFEENNVVETVDSEINELDEQQEVQQELEDFEFEVEGEPEANKPVYTPEQTLTHKLTKERKKRQAAQQEAQEKDQLIADLTKQLEGSKTDTYNSLNNVSHIPEPPAVPDLYSPEINGDSKKLNQKWLEYNNKLKEYVRAREAPKIDHENFKADIERRASRLGKDAAGFIKKHNIKQDVVIDAIELAKNEIDNHLNLDGAFVNLISRLGEKGSQVAYYLGKNPGALQKVKLTLDADKSGLEAAVYLGEIKTKLKRKGLSNAPAPDEPLQGNGSSKAALSLQSKYDKATSVSEILKLKRQAKDAGVTLK